MKSITQETLKDLFDYREDGHLVRKTSTNGSSRIGDLVGNLNSKYLGTRNNRYVVTKISGQHWCVHKLIYLYHYGVVPEQLDHINGNTLDNRIENLRTASANENMQNRKKFSNNSSGVKNVSWHKKQEKWFVYIDANKKRKSIGYFNDLEFAELVANEARNKFHKTFAHP